MAQCLNYCFQTHGRIEWVTKQLNIIFLWRENPLHSNERIFFWMKNSCYFNGWILILFEWITLAILNISRWHMASKPVFTGRTNLCYNIFLCDPRHQVENWNYTKRKKHYCCNDQAHLRCLVNLQLFRHTFLYKQETRKNHKQNEASQDTRDETN